MKKWIILAAAFMAAVSCSRKTDHIDYTLSWSGDGITVYMKVASRQDTIQLSYGSDAGGIKDQASWIQGLEASRGLATMDPSGRSLTVITDKGAAWFSYTVRCTLPEGYGSPGGCIMDVFRPDFDDKMLFTRCENLFATPDDWNIPVTVRWDKTPDYPVFCLYNPESGTGPFKGKAGQVRNSVMVGDPLLEVDSVMVDGNINYLVTALRKDKEYNKPELKDYFRSFYRSATQFWDEGYTEPYTMVLFPFRGNTFEVTGNGFPNGFMSRYDATADTVLTTGRRDVFTHEIGHKWIGSDPAWFGEGFNEMQTGYQLVASGLEAPEYFATYFNIALSGLHANPHRNVPGDLAEERFWEDGSYIWLLYWRGYCYAFHLAGLIEKETGEPNAWRLMMDEIKPFLHDFTPERFLSAMGKFIPMERVEDDYRTFMVEGRDFVFKPEELPSGCTMEYLGDGTPQLRVTDHETFARHFK